MTDTTLTADQSEDDVEASVAAAGPRESDFLIQIGDEYQYVEWRGDQFVHPWQVKRGFLGTLPVAHSSGATVTVEPAIGGGGDIAATDAQIVYMNGADPVGSADLTWDATSRILSLDSRENGHAVIRGLGVGTELNVEAADGDATHPGGEITIQSGSSAGNDGGQIQILTGGDEDGGNSGFVLIKTGASPDGSSGDIDIRAGGSGGSASYQGGDINIVAGSGSGSSGGNVIIQAGAKTTGGSHGSVQLYDGSGSNSIEVNSSGVFLNGNVIGTQAAHVADDSTVDQLRNALIASGLMAAS